jgi:tRNA G37 N-methylase TrmD
MRPEGICRDGKRWRSIRKLRRKERMRKTKCRRKNLWPEKKEDGDYDFDRIEEQEESAKVMRRSRKYVGRRRGW